MASQQALCFPAGFLWGTATSAHQTEGGNTNNQWWVWEQEPGHVWHNERSGRACDWWQRAEDDLATAAGLGQNSHRLSIEWSRIEPRQGEFDSAALDRYRRLLGRMRELGLEPMVTLHHFTNPLWFERQGAWLSPQAPTLLARFGARAAAALGDLATLWCTINEPTIVATQAYLYGIWPPMHRSLVSAVRVVRNMVAAHAAAYHAIKDVRPQAQVGQVAHLRLFEPARPSSPLDRGVARLLDHVFNRATVLAQRDGRLRFPFSLGEHVAGTDCDFIGINYYTRDRVAFDLRHPGELFARRFYTPGAEMCDPGWHGSFGEIYPAGLYRCLMDYAPLGRPLYVTENGWADAADTRRPRALITHIAQMGRALQAGAPVRGYFHWTLVDNFEWAEGWGARFGLIALDPETQERRLRPSAEVYAAIVRANGITPEIVRRYAPEAERMVFGYVPSG
ncbi:MAG: glycoside hydrolase family 1 protein [Anaerolineae bacterium]